VHDDTRRSANKIVEGTAERIENARRKAILFTRTDRGNRRVIFREKAIGGETSIEKPGTVDLDEPVRGITRRYR
jgi:hypothetical protein